MITNNPLKEISKVKNVFSTLFSGKLSAIFSKKTLSPFKTTNILALLTVLTCAGCSTIQQKVSAAADAIQTDAQIAHDGNFRIKRVRSCLASGDILGAQEHRDTLHSMHYRCIADIEIAAAKYPMQKAEALEGVKKTTEDIWNISDANKRAMALLALLKFELETQGDIPQAKETIKQTEKTIAFILDEHSRKMQRYGELQLLLEKNNHLLSR